MEDIGDNDGWCNGKKALRWWNDYVLLFQIGGRGIGKTDLWLHVACELYQRHGCKTVWCRNKKVELSEDGNFEGFLNDAKLHGWCPDDWECKPDGVWVGEERAIEFQSISTFSNRRGAASPSVLMVLLDEMLPEDGRYPKQCAKGLMSLAHTILRGRPGAKVIALSNFVTAGNPYFAKFEVYPHPKYDVTVYKDKAIAIEVCRGYRRAIKEESQWSQLFKAGGMHTYDDDSEDPLIGLIETPPNGAVPEAYYFLIDGQIYRGSMHKGIEYFDAYKGQLKEDSIIFTPNVNEMRPGITLCPSWLMKDLNKSFASGWMRFKSPNVMFKILNMLYEVI